MTKSKNQVYRSPFPGTLLGLMLISIAIICISKSHFLGFTAPMNHLVYREVLNAAIVVLASMGIWLILANRRRMSSRPVAVIDSQSYSSVPITRTNPVDEDLYWRKMKDTIFRKFPPAIGD